MVDSEPVTRAYVQRDRAAAVQRTREAILEAAVGLGYRQPLAQVTLPAIAAEARVSVQTLLRQFGSRDGVIDAAVAWARPEVLAERTADADDVEASLAAIVDHYERVGDGVLLLLGQESWEPVAARVTSPGKRLHREWVEKVFPARPAEIHDLLVVATDVYAWKLLRRDRGLSRDDTLARVTAMVEAVIADC